MPKLGYWWPFAETVWGWTVATIGGVAALYYGPRKVLETFDWYMDRFVDYKVNDFLHSHVIKSKLQLPGGGRGQTATPKTVGEIARATDMSEKRVRGCLQRLRRRKCVTQESEDKWRADVSHVTVW
jgi:hypothetical protein